MYLPNGDLITERKPVFLNGISLMVRFEPQIDWGEDATCKEIQYITPKHTYKYNSEQGITLDVGHEFGTKGSLKIVAINSKGRRAEYEVPFVVVDPPISGNYFFNDDHYETYTSATLHFIHEHIDESKIPTTIPIFGGKEIGFSLPLDVDVSIGIDGRGVFKLSYEHGLEKYIEFAGKKVPLVEKKRGRGVKLDFYIEPDLSLTCNYDEHQNSWTWNGRIALSVGGYTKTPPYSRL